MKADFDPETWECLMAIGAHHKELEYGSKCARGLNGLRALRIRLTVEQKRLQIHQRHIERERIRDGRYTPKPLRAPLKAIVKFLRAVSFTRLSP